MTNQFPWMQHTLYEPAPLPANYGRTRAPMTLRVFGMLAVIFIVCGTLAAVCH